MKENGKMILKYWVILINPLFLAIYIVGFRSLYLLCQFGGIKRRLPTIILCGSIGIIWSVVWTAIYMKGKHKKKEIKPIQKKAYIVLLLLEIILLLCTTGYYGSKIIHSAKAYNGKLSWKLDEMKHSKKILLEHNNFYEDGVNGIFINLKEKLELPSELYIANKFSLEFDEDGTITSLYSFFYGKDENGTNRTFLLDYDKDKSEEMTVWLDGNAECTYAEQMKMKPMFELLDRIDMRKQTQKWKDQSKISHFSMEYKGYTSFNNRDELVYMNKEENSNIISMEKIQNEVFGYGVLLNAPDNEDITLVQFVDTAHTIDIEKEQKMDLYKSGSCITDKNDGTLYYFLNEKQGWRLVIVDAALGTRYYGMEYTDDGGTTWNETTNDPFGGKGGTANGILFLDEKTGFIGINNASDDHAEIYLTNDSGKTFAEVKLPMEQIAEEISIRDYDYIFMPYSEASKIYVEVGIESNGTERILFESDDNGINWRYIG